MDVSVCSQVRSRTRSPALSFLLDDHFSFPACLVTIPQKGVQALEAFVPEVLVLADPLGRLLQAGAIEAAWPPLRVPALRDQSSPLEHFQVLGDAGQAR